MSATEERQFTRVKYLQLISEVTIVKICLYTMLVSVGLICLHSSASGRESVDCLKLRIKEASPHGIIVEISNFSKGPCRIWKESNSWGVSRWRLIRIRAGKVDALCQNPDREFTKNGPEFLEIAGGTHVDQKLDLTDGSWRGLSGEEIRLERGDLIVAIYDVPSTPESLKFGVWYGVAVTSMTIQ